MDKLIDVPNLDDLSTDPKDYVELGFVFRDLASYCLRKALAIKNRTDGTIQAAQQFESEMKDIYEQLPEWTKW